MLATSSGQDRVHRHTGAGAQLRQAARHGELRGLGRAVVNHLGRDLDRALAADEDDAAQFGVFMPSSTSRLSRTPLRTFTSKNRVLHWIVPPAGVPATPTRPSDNRRP